MIKRRAKVFWMATLKASLIGLVVSFSIILADEFRRVERIKDAREKREHEARIERAREDLRADMERATDKLRGGLQKIADDYRKAHGLN